MSKKRSIVCMFCGKGFGYEGDKPDDETLKAACNHEAVCAQNPYIHLIAFLSRYITEMRDCRLKCMSMSPEDCLDAVKMQWPEIQGMKNQYKIKQLGNMSYDPEIVGQAVQLILGAADEEHS